MTKDDDIYREELLEHYRNPNNNTIIKNPDIHKTDSNPLCGDNIEIFVEFEKDKNNTNNKTTKNTIKNITFIGDGCVISKVCASLLTEHLEGKTIEYAKKMDREQMLKLLSINVSPSRVKCAMLALTALKKGIADYENQNNNIKNTVLKKKANEVIA